MHCPKCDADTENISCQHITVDRCKQCKGIWFDLLEHEELKQIKGSECIDIGEPDTEINQDMQCPKCNVNMLLLSDPAHPQVEFQKCPVCHGAYFDAGKFRLLKENAFSRLIRSIFKR
ncbi:MAG: zf-TFIIB domain-containing protein [Chitinivibrionales bacterium]